MTMRPVLARGALFAMVVLLTSCGGSIEAPAAPAAAVASIAVSTLPAQMMAGDVAQLTATVIDTRSQVVSDRAVTWSSSDDQIATVSAAGQVTALGHGSVTVTATVEGKSASATTATTLTYKERRFAYTLVASNAPVNGTANPSMTENATGGGVTIAHPSTGDYTVTFARMARADTSWRETVMLTMSAGGATHCHVNDWQAAPNGRDLDVSVSCYATDNSRMGASFSLLVLGGGSIEGRHSFVYSTGSSRSYTPPPQTVYNSSGQAMTVSHMSSGTYRVDVNNPRVAMAENYFVTTLGNPAATCVLGGWSYGTYSIADCNGPSTSADARFAMQMIEGGRTGKRFGFAWASLPNQTFGSEYVPSTTYQRMSNGQQVAITHTTMNSVVSGIYDVRFPGFGGLQASKHNVQLSAYASGRASCYVNDQTTASGGVDLVVRVNCYDRYSGAPTNAFFTILVIE